MPTKAMAALLVFVAAQSVAAQAVRARPAQAPNRTPARPTRPPRLSSFAAPRSTYAPPFALPLRDRRSLAHGFSPWPLGYGYAAPYAAGGPPPAGQSDDSSIGQPEASGEIAFDVEPPAAQIYVDGFYVGTVDDFQREGVNLPAGRHWIDLRASGYEALTIPVNIAAGQAARYRGNLTAARAQAAIAVPPRGPTIIYVIPGCYAGNTPPAESSLARGCDVARLHVLNPR
jgi:hypothetical protein